eukprot:CAMPEP_0181364900 /NCGR_PEP_ID=MMETSP1106-20121128/9712_1 /TAXON_ID=81844 /ORGANISM="Mantoniella antarctica, Strain SL-175" /LENGTH=201 /DNA_ID=CAMNT_0023479803 /DNA_START=186 /DNA_END=787 /DNA_ORIENTATION=-
MSTARCAKVLESSQRTDSFPRHPTYLHPHAEETCGNERVQARFHRNITNVTLRFSGDVNREASPRFRTQLAAHDTLSLTASSLLTAPQRHHTLSRSLDPHPLRHRRRSSDRRRRARRGGAHHRGSTAVVNVGRAVYFTGKGVVRDGKGVVRDGGFGAVAHVAIAANVPQQLSDRVRMLGRERGKLVRVLEPAVLVKAGEHG